MLQFKQAIFFILQAIFLSLIIVFATEFYQLTNQTFLWLLSIAISLSLINTVVIIILFFWQKHHWSIILLYLFSMMSLYPLELLVILFFRHKSAKAAPIVIKKLQELKIPFHAVFGTFLFIYRDQNFRDTDIDLGIWESDFKEEYIQKMQANGFFLKKVFGFDQKIYEYSFQHLPTKCQVDIFLLKKQDATGYSFDPKNNRYARKKEKLVYDLKEYRIKGIAVKGPADAEKYLESAYGEWKVRDPSYHWFYGGKNGSEQVIFENVNNIFYQNFKNDFK